MDKVELSSCQISLLPRHDFRFAAAIADGFGMRRSTIPDETIQVAQAAFPKGNRYLRVRDTFGPLFENPAFAHLFSHTGQPAQDPARLALVTILQFAERSMSENK